MVSKRGVWSSPIRFILLLAIVGTCLVPSKLVAQVTLHGKIVDDTQSAHSPVAYQSVKVYTGLESFGTLTDSAGNFRIYLPAHDDYDSLTTHISGYLRSVWQGFSNGDTLFLSQLTVDSVVGAKLIDSPLIFTHPITDGPQPQFVFQDVLVRALPFYSDRSGLLASTFRGKFEIEGQDPVSLQPLLNTISGVKMDSRGAGGSRRVSIRGSLLRSPFGVRNIKAYWDDMPLSIPDGSVPIELVDPVNLSFLAVAKGPSSSGRSSVNGGALFFGGGLPETYGSGIQAETGLQIGSYGSIRSASSFALSTRKFWLFASYVHQELEGYREQESNRKDHVNVRAAWKLAPKHSLIGYFWQYDGDWDLPGALNDSIAQADPRSAVPYSITANASVERVRTRVGATHYWSPLHNIDLKSTAYTYRTTKINPYGTSPFFNGFKDEAGWGLGGRTVLTMRSNQEYSRWFPIQSNLGFEYQQDLNNQLEFDNDEGAPDSLRIDRLVRSTTGLLFANTQFKWKKGVELFAGIDANLLNYDLTDRFDADAIDYTGKRAFSPFLSPHIEASWEIVPEFELSAKVDWGYSPPSFWEISNSDGSINTDLNPEDGLQYSVAGKLYLFKRLLFIKAEAYALSVSNTIIPSTLPSGEVVFANQGSTQQNGIELEAGYYHISSRKFVRFAYPWISFAYQPYTFKDGKDMTGIPLVTAAAGILLEIAPGFYVTTNTRYNGKTALNDDNTVYQDPYVLLDAKVGWKKTVKKRFILEVYGGANNLLNEQYTSFLQLNGFGGKFYNPAPVRNYYGGIKVGYTIDHL